MSETTLPVSLRGYRMLTGLSAPLLNALLLRRAGRGKEDPGRSGERRGEAGLARPEGFLVWIHAISVGEANSVLPLVNALIARDPKLSVLLTTGTLTAGRLMAERLPATRSVHQFIPLDHPEWVARFFAHWRPDLGLIAESELWPNLLLNAEARGIPLVLLNARISARTTQRWLRHPRTIGRLLRCFSLCLAQDTDSAARLCALGARHVETPGNLKFAAPPLPDKPTERATLEARFGKRPRFLAASTHPGEEELIADTHQILKPEWPDLLTVIVPRHPERGIAIAELLRARGLAVERRMDKEHSATPEIFIADTLGELGLFYRLCPIVFIGGSLVPVGGQNPLEPARLDCAILHGPHTDNFAQIMARFDAAGASKSVADAAALAAALRVLLASPVAREARARAGAAIAAAEAGVLDAILSRLSLFLPRADHATA